MALFAEGYRRETSVVTSSLAKLSRADLESVVNLIGEVQEIPEDITLRRKHILRRLGELIGTQVGVAITARNFLLGADWQPIIAVDDGFADTHRRAALMERLCGVKWRDPVTPAILRDPAKLTVYRREDAIERDEWQRSHYYNQILRPAGLEECIKSAIRLGRPGVSAGFAMYRERGNTTPFTQRDCALLALVNRQLEWMYRHELESHPEGWNDLPPRLLQVLTMLCSGLSEKQVAARMELSVHTVHEHVRRLYRRFNVTSRGELIALAGRPRQPSEAAEYSV